MFTPYSILLFLFHLKIYEPESFSLTHCQQFHCSLRQVLQTLKTAAHTPPSRDIPPPNITSGWSKMTLSSTSTALLGVCASPLYSADIWLIKKERLVVGWWSCWLQARYWLIWTKWCVEFVEPDIDKVIALIFTSILYWNIRSVKICTFHTSASLQIVFFLEFVHKCRHTKWLTKE